MDYPVIDQGMMSDAVVVWANHYQCSPGEVVLNPGVESRALIWSDAGVGEIRSGSVHLNLTRRRFAFLPWRHTIRYEASLHDPFMVSGIHLIPWHDPTEPVRLHAAHGRNDDLAGVPTRRDADWPDLSGALTGTDTSGRLLDLANLIVEHVQHGRPEAVTLRAFAAVLLNELRAALAGSGPEGHTDRPARLIRMEQFALSHVTRPLSVAQIAAAGSMSESTAERLFRQHHGRPVGRWLTEQRMTMAQDLLRTTNSTIAEVAAAVGMPDQGYFSRVFRRRFGLPPSHYAIAVRHI
jgi:AraC-like DNA-binding protein